MNHVNIEELQIPIFRKEGTEANLEKKKKNPIYVSFIGTQDKYYFPAMAENFSTVCRC